MALKFRLQVRQNIGLRQWKSPRGWVSRVQFSQWKTIAKFEDLEQARSVGNAETRVGLKEFRVLYGKQVVADS